jgi:hypothetical protein
MDELTRVVAQRAGITAAEAALAVAAMLGYLTARLPSPLVGRIREEMGVVQSSRQPGVREDDAK